MPKKTGIGGFFTFVQWTCLSVAAFSCSGQNSGDVSKDLADKLTDSMDFTDGTKKSGTKPVEHAGDTAYPQVTNVLVEQGGSLYETTFTWRVEYAYAGPVSELTGAIVHVADASGYWDVKQTLTEQGQLAVLTGTFKAVSDSIIGKSFTIEVGLYNAKGVGNYYNKLTITPQKGASSTVDPMAAMNAFSFGGDTRTESFGGDVPAGEKEPIEAPQISGEIVMPAQVGSGVQFDVTIPYEYAGGRPYALLFQVKGAGAYLKVPLKAVQITSDRVTVPMKFDAGTDGTVSALAMKGGTGAVIRGLVTTLSLVFALADDKGRSGTPVGKGLEINDEAPQDGGFDAGTDGGRDVGTDAGSDAGIDSGMDGGLPPDASIDAGTDTGTDAGFDGGSCASAAPVVDCQNYGGVLGWQCSMQTGCFLMGCNAAVDNECETSEDPYHAVTTAAYKVDQHEVTVAEYKSCVNSVPSGCTAAGTTAGCNYGAAGRDDHPINCLGWDQAKAYCQWAGKRLPSEAEWEKAARGTDGRKYPWGNTGLDCDHAVMSVAPCSNSSTQPVGSKPQGASPYGVQDMVGNVWEWVEDDWHDSYNNAPADGGAWVDEPRGANRVVRGGGWLLQTTAYLRTSNRFGFAVSPGDQNVGFRCAR